MSFANNQKLFKMKGFKMQIKTYLPAFSGFYETSYQLNSDNELDYINEDRKEKKLSPINWDQLKIDYSTYELDIVKTFCDTLKEYMNDFIVSIELERIIYPKEYNFANNSADVIIDIIPENITNFIYDHKEKFSEFLKKRYTSYDGFISHYNNDFKSWEVDTKNFTDFSVDGHRLGSVLDFIFYTAGNKSDNICYDVMENINTFAYIENYNECVNNPSCGKCNDIIESEDILTAMKKFKKLTRKTVKTIYCEKCLELYNN